jgi:hypothetical protein
MHLLHGRTLWAAAALPKWVACVLIGLAIAGCSSSQSSSDERKAAEWVLSQGGTLVTDKVLEVKTADRLPKNSFEIERIDLRDAKIGDADLEKISGLTHLKYLGLYGTPVTDVGMNHLARLQSLRALELSYTQVGDPGLISLKTLNSLEKLWLTGTPVSDAAVEEFKKSRPGCEVVRLK